MTSLLIFFWVFVGISVFIHEIRMDMDIDLFTLMFAILMGSIAGPLILFRTLYRKGPFIIFKKYTK